MSRYKVYSQDGRTERCTLNKVEYNGSFMDSRIVTASVESSKPLGFDIYDYITYRGEKFELDYIPTSTKVASTGSVGNAYTYELQFVSLKYELERCQMRDLVPYDNGVVYPTPLTIEFTGTAEKLAERIEACLDKMYSGTKKWNIIVLPGTSDEEKNISISQANCWSAVSLFNTEYGLNFFISGRTITVGDTGAAIDYTFSYGKGNGLYKIERTSDTQQGIVTRLRAYGGTQNIGDNYLRDKTTWPDSVLPANMYIPNLMLPGFETTQIDYIESDNISEYGVREGSIVYEDIYPSIVGMTNSKGQRIDTLKGAESITNDSASEFWILTYDLEFEKPLEDYIVTGGIPTVYIKSGQLQGYSFEINTSKIEKQSDGGYKLYLSRNTDNSYTVPNKDVNLTAGTEFVFLGIAMPKAYIESAEQRLLERAKEYLSKYSKTNFGYDIGLDEIFAARTPSIYENLYEGKKLRVVDTDLGIDEEITIQSLTITEEDGGIPIYKITLNNEVSASTLNRIQGQVSQLESTVTNGFTLLKWQTEQYYRKMGRPYALWTRDSSGMWLYIDEESLYATLDATLGVKKDIICYAVDETVEDLEFPVASYTQKGIVQVEAGGALKIENGILSLIGGTGGGGGGLDVESLKEYLTTNKYLQASSLLDGYKLPEKYTPITGEDTYLSAIAKLERHFDDYVTIATEQTITGAKTFDELILGKKDIVCYAVGDVEDVGFPIASATSLGMVKVGAGLSIDSSGVLTSTGGGGGGVDFTVGTGLQMSGSVLSVKYGSSSGTACQGNDSRLSNDRPCPYALSWSGYSSGSYDGSSSRSFTIPSNTSQLTNGAGFIKDANGNFTVLYGSGRSSQYLAGNGQFYTISYNDLANTPNLNLYVKKAGDTMTGNLGIDKGTPALILYGSRTWQIRESGGDLQFLNSGSTAGYFSGVNNGNFSTGNVIASEDIICNSASSSMTDVTAIATTGSYGVVKYDGSTIGKNSSGQLYVINGGGGGGGSSVTVVDSLTSTSKTSALSANQGYQLDQRLKNIRWGSPDGTDYVRTYLGSTYKDLSKNGHSHSWSTISSKPSWIGSSKPSYSWSEITSKPSIISSIYVSRSGSGSVVTSLSVSGSTIYYNMGNVSGGSSWNGGTISNGITISSSGTVGLSINTSNGFVKFGSYWKIQNGSDLNFYYGSGGAVAYFSASNRGNLWIAGSLSQNSDIRLKTVSGYLGGILPQVAALDVFRFTYKSDTEGRVRIGLSAQQVIQSFPEFVFLESSGYYSMDYAGLSALAIQGVKELYTRILPVENEVKILKNKVKDLQAQLRNAWAEIDQLKGKEAA